MCLSKKKLSVEHHDLYAWHCGRCHVSKHCIRKTACDDKTFAEQVVGVAHDLLWLGIFEFTRGLMNLGKRLAQGLF